MKTHQVVLAAVIFASGWSANVVYQYQAGSNRIRTIASVAEEINSKNIDENISKLDLKLAELKQKKKDLGALIESKSSVKDLLKLREEELSALQEDKELFLEQKKRINQFLGKNEKSANYEAEAKVTKINKSALSLNLSKEKKKLKEKLAAALEKQAANQEELMSELEVSLCKQNKELSSLTEKIDKLLADKEEILDEVNPPSVFQGMNYPFAMTPLDFFQARPQMPMVSESNPMGLDYNFLMLTQMLSSTMSLGPKPSVNYAPIYNQNQSYFGMPQSFSLSDQAQFNTGTQMLLGNPASTTTPQLRGPLTGIDAGYAFVPSFVRNPANSVEIPLTQ